MTFRSLVMRWLTELRLLIPRFRTLGRVDGLAPFDLRRMMNALSQTRIGGNWDLDLDWPIALTVRQCSVADMEFTTARAESVLANGQVCPFHDGVQFT